MKKVGLALLAILTLLLIILAPSVIMASGINTGPQTWSLDSKNDTDSQKLPPSVSQMERNYGPGDDGQSGSVIINGGSSYVWIADQPAEYDVTFPSGAWVLQIVTDADWGTKGSLCQMEIVEWNGITFNSLTPLPQNVSSRVNSTVIIKTLFQTGSLTIHKGRYLALRIKNLETLGKNHIVYTGEGVNNSYLRSPETTSLFAPLPELPAGLLLALGLAGLGTFIVIRHKAQKKAST